MNIYFINEPCFNDFFLCDEAGLIIQVQFKIFGSIHRIQVLFIAEITYFYILSSSNYKNVVLGATRWNILAMEKDRSVLFHY